MYYHPFFCHKHAATFTLKSNLNWHIHNSGCGADDGDTCLPVLDDIVVDEEQYVLPLDIDSDQDVVLDPPPPLEPFPGWDSLIPIGLLVLEIISLLGLGNSCQNNQGHTLPINIMFLVMEWPT